MKIGYLQTRHENSLVDSAIEDGIRRGHVVSRIKSMLDLDSPGVGKLGEVIIPVYGSILPKASVYYLDRLRKFSRVISWKYVQFKSYLPILIRRLKRAVIENIYRFIVFGDKTLKCGVIKT